jgi:hypothetical protein
MSIRVAAINGNFEGEGPPFYKIVSYGRGDKGPVCKEGEEKPFLFGIGVDVEKIGPGKDFTSRVKEPETTGVRDFVQDAAVFLISEFAEYCLPVTCVQVVIAVSALHVAAPGQFDRAAKGGSLGHDLLVKL